ncbi:predicted protein [Lichtheimia corymbifera JMRC:FSU:9682]|uniref:Uncharacterized protein n=1 Tax=Lichtheimia corymbifera JMRC:FSU:9682 TaxID=1263082 RepID=A0A068RXW7_9FUNG|nr:predicted protein [Lichtheimia corymbifera JMRC:FSU:9682]
MELSSPLDFFVPGNVNTFDGKEDQMGMVTTLICLLSLEGTARASSKRLYSSYCVMVIHGGLGCTYHWSSFWRFALEFSMEKEIASFW